MSVRPAANFVLEYVFGFVGPFCHHGDLKLELVTLFTLFFSLNVSSIYISTMPCDRQTTL